MADQPLAGVDADALIDGRAGWLDASHAAALAAHPAACVETEYPHWGYTRDGPAPPPAPSEHHPVFYGCFDWHSAVHSHWCLVRLARLVDSFAGRPEILAGLEERLTAEAVAGEVAFFEDNPSFERPYGWGWFLRLVAELDAWGTPTARAWRGLLEPLEATIVGLVASYLSTQPYPARVGTHGNSAFGLQCIREYAESIGDDGLLEAVEDTARRFYLTDEAYPFAYEPLAWDFLSPGLVEADLMGQVLASEAFVDWFDAFAPALLDGEGVAVLDPVALPDDGGLERHLVGLNLSRAWSLADVADRSEGAGADRLAAAARRHAVAGVARAFDDDYAGTHWLTSYTVYLATRNAFDP